MPLRGVRTPKLRVILECGLKWHSNCWSAECQLRWSAKWHSAILHSTGWSASRSAYFALQHSNPQSNLAVQSALHTPGCMLFGSKFGVKIGLECGVEDGLECGVECSTPICTPIQLVEWSAVWSAAIHTPKIILDWSADCTPKIMECQMP